MDNPGPIQLTMSGSAFGIVGPGTFIGDVICGLAGMKSASFQAQFLYGSGGESAAVYFQTSIDQGQTWIDIAAIEFETESGTEIVNLSALTTSASPMTPTQQGLAPGSCVDGFLGDRLRAVVVVAGNYANGTLLNATAVAR